MYICALECLQLSRWLFKRTLKDADGSSKVVDPSGGLEGSGNNGSGGDEIVGKGVVQVALANDN